MSTLAAIVPTVALIRVDASPTSVVMACRCGWRGIRAERAAARAEADRHITEQHPRQAQYVTAARRRRAALTGGR